MQLGMIGLGRADLDVHRDRIIHAGPRLRQAGFARRLRFFLILLGP